MMIKREIQKKELPSLELYVNRQVKFHILCIFRHIKLHHFKDFIPLKRNLQSNIQHRKSIIKIRCIIHTVNIEHMDHEFGTHYDDHRENYSAEIQEAQNEYELQQWYDEYMTKVYEAGFGDDSDAYEASWKRIFQYAQSGAIDDLLENNA